VLYAAAAFLVAMVGVVLTIVGVVMAAAIVTPALDAGTTLNGAEIGDLLRPALLITLGLALAIALLGVGLRRMEAVVRVLNPAPEAPATGARPRD
jgi:hypothetical protein